jgi:hypothetical protein
MLQNLAISDTLYKQLETTAQNSGFTSLEDFLAELVRLWETRAEELRRRHQVVTQIDELRTRLWRKYGVMSDSVDLIREDRTR